MKLFILGLKLDFFEHYTIKGVKKLKKATLRFELGGDFKESSYKLVSVYQKVYAPPTYLPVLNTWNTTTDIQDLIF